MDGALCLQYSITILENTSFGIFFAVERAISGNGNRHGTVDDAGSEKPWRKKLKNFCLDWLHNLQS